MERMIYCHSSHMTTAFWLVIRCVAGGDVITCGVCVRACVRACVCVCVCGRRRHDCRGGSGGGCVVARVDEGSWRS